ISRSTSKASLRRWTNAAGLPPRSIAPSAPHRREPAGQEENVAMNPQDRTLDRYQELMQINAASHVLRAARQVGIFEELRGGQRTAEQLAETLRLDRAGLDLLLDCLISMNVIERYQDDHALAPVMQLLCQYDADLGDAD